MAEIIQDRFRQISDNLTSFQSDLESTISASNRKISDISVIAVTKGFPIADIEILAKLGITDIGESKNQEIKHKLPTINELNLNLHFIGQLQRNKAKSVASYSRVVHSVDRKSLIDEIVKLVPDQELPTILLQVDLAKTPNPNRGGASPDEILKLADYAVQSGFELKGLMAVAPVDLDPEVSFNRFALISEKLVGSYPGAHWRSIGMSADWQMAIRYGATHLRIGSALLGNRA